MIFYNALKTYCLLAVLPGMGALALAAAPANTSRVDFQITDHADPPMHLEVRLAPLAEVLSTLSTKTGVPIHYSVLPEGLVSATCLGANLKLIVECLLSGKADLIVRNPQVGKSGKPSSAMEMWILGARYNPTPMCADTLPPPMVADPTPAPPAPSAFAETEAIEGLLASAKAADATTRASAIGALLSVGKAGDARIKATLTAALSDPDANVRAQAISSLAYREGAAATAAIQTVLQDEDAGVRLMAVAGIVADEALLQQAVNDDDENVRQLALSKLKQLQDNRRDRQ